jgi:hypothetical protein
MRNIDIPKKGAPVSMSAQLGVDSAFLLLSILSGTGAAALLIRGILSSKLQNTAGSSSTNLSKLADPRWRPSILDKITLLNRNLAQCPRCFMIDSANIRFCSRCGMEIYGRSDLLRNEIHNIEVQHLTQDDSTHVIGLSMNIDPKTKVGVIIGVQNREAPDLTEAQSQIQRRTEPTLYS